MTNSSSAFTAGLCCLLVAACVRGGDQAPPLAISAADSIVLAYIDSLLAAEFAERPRTDERMALAYLRGDTALRSSLVHLADQQGSSWHPNLGPATLVVDSLHGHSMRGLLDSALAEGLALDAIRLSVYSPWWRTLSHYEIVQLVEEDEALVRETHTTYKSRGWPPRERVDSTVTFSYSASPFTLRILSEELESVEFWTASAHIDAGIACCDCTDIEVEAVSCIAKAAGRSIDMAVPRHHVVRRSCPSAATAYGRLTAPFFEHPTNAFPTAPQLAAVDWSRGWD